MKQALFFFCLLWLVTLSLPAQQKAELTLKDGLQLLQDEKYVTLFEQANAAVAANAGSIQGNFFMGLALREGEGNLPLARRSLEITKRLLETKRAAGVQTETEKEIYRLTLEGLLEIYATSEQYADELSLIELARTDANLDWSSMRGWPLMKLGRIDEARAAMLGALNSTDPKADPKANSNARQNACNTLGALESAAWNYQASYAWFTQLIEKADARDLTATDYSNRGETALSLQNFAGAESDFRQATERFRYGSHTNPWMEVTPLYLQTGRLPFAVSAVQKMRAWDAASDPTLEQERWSREQLVVGLVQLAAGRDQQAVETTGLLLRRPDRLGNNSASPRESEIASLDLYIEGLRRTRERTIESMSWSGPIDWCRELGRTVGYTAELWLNESRLRALVVRNADGLDWSLRPYGPNSDVQEYLRPGLNRILGPGIVASEVSALLQRTSPQAEHERPYLQGMLGESLVERGEFDAALAPLSSSLQSMPGEERLLRGRLEALLGFALERTGAQAAALTHYSLAMELDPHAFRSLSIALPVTIDAGSQDDAAANLAGSWLRSSPRFREGRGFTIRIQRNGVWLEASLLGASGEVLARATVLDRDKPRAVARKLCAAVHDSFFNAPLSLEQADIDSIDGSPLSLDPRQVSLEALLGGGSKKD